MTGTASKSTPMSGKEMRSVSPGISALLPDVLIEYLWGLALREDRRSDGKQVFVLEAGKLSGRSIQEISHFYNSGNSFDTRRVYGVEPVNCRLQVLRYEGGYEMQLCIGQ